MDRCGTCGDTPIFGCRIFGCQPEGCFIKCPECGRLGFTEPPNDFVPDMELAAMLTERRNKWKESV